MSKLINFSKSLIDEICEKSPDVTTAFLDFYNVAIPEFDEVKQIKGFPVVSEETAKYCIEKLHEKTNDAWNVNSLWLNNGFSSDRSIPDWFISTEKVQLIF